MVSATSSHDCWSVSPSCHCHSWLHHGQCYLKTRLLVCTPILSLSQLVTPWSVLPQDTTVCLHPYFVTVTVGYIMVSPTPRHDCWSAPLSFHCHSWLHYGQSYLKTRLLAHPPKFSLSQLVTSWSVPAPDNTVGLYTRLSLSQLVTSRPVLPQDTTAGLAPLVVIVASSYIMARPTFKHLFLSVP